MFETKKVLSLLKWLFAIIFGLAVLGQLQRVELQGAKAFYLHDVVLVLSLPLLVYSLRSKLTLPRSFLFFNVLIIFSLTRSWLGVGGILSPLLYLLRFDAYLIFGLGIIAHTRTKLGEGWPKTLALISIGGIALLGIVQYFLLPDTRNLVFLGWDDHYLRLISTFYDPGFTGIVLAMGALVIQRDLFKKKVTTDVVLALRQMGWMLMLGSLLLTYSRASFLAYLVGTLCLFIYQRNKAHLAAATFFVLAIFCLPRGRSEGVRLERTASINARLASYNQTKPRNLGEIAFGSGWYSGKVEETRDVGGNLVTSHNSAPDNSFIFIFSSLGIVGLITFFWLIRDLSKVGGVASVSVPLLVAISTHALFSNTWFYPFVLLFLFPLMSGKDD